MGAYGSPELYPKNRNSKHTDWGKNMVHCKKCHTVYHKAFSRCPECNTKNPRKGTMLLWIPFACVGGVFIILMGVFTAKLMRNQFAGITARTESAEQAQGQIQVQVQEQPQETEEEFKGKCAVIPYKDIERNPNNYVGQYAVFEGRVVQVAEEGSDVTLRVDTKKGKYGLWDDTIYVDYKRHDANESRILEGDMVKMYGIVQGLKTYIAIFGNSVSIPHLEARYIELKSE